VDVKLDWLCRYLSAIFAPDLALPHRLPLPNTWPLAPQWVSVSTRSPQTQLPPDHQEEASGGIQSQPIPIYLTLAPGSSTTSELPGTTTRARSSIVWVLLAKSRHRSMDRLLCKLGTLNAVSLSIFYISMPIYPLFGDLADHSDSLWNPAGWNPDPAHSQRSLYNHSP